MHKVLFDCDNTMGVKDCDVDDGLTLLYLLGRKDIELLGVTTTSGNSTIEVVHQNTTKMFDDLTISHIPLYKGCPNSTIRESDACRFLVDCVNKHPGEITFLATGSLTNLYGAYLLDRSFFDKLKTIVLMGGITEPLLLNGKNLDELNFACDPLASYHVLTANTKVTVLTGHICLQAFFGKNEYNRLKTENAPKIYRYIYNYTIQWYETVMEQFGLEGFYNWDIVAAVYITHPHLFENDFQKLISTPEDLKKGYLKIDPSASEGHIINIPKKIKDVETFNQIIFDTWKNVQL